MFLGCFYGLYVLIDYSSHSSGTHYQHSHLKWIELSLYYMCEFVQRLDVLLPFAILLGTIRTLYNLNAHSELVAMMASGMKLKTLLRPFILIGLLGTVLLYANTEYFIPSALQELRHMADRHALSKKKQVKNMQVNHVVLEDESTVLFQKYDTAHEYFFDTYWIRSSKDIYKIQRLYLGISVPMGKNVVHLVRNDAGDFVQKETFESREFPEIRFNKKTLLDTITPVEEFSISSLWKKFPSHNDSLSEKEAQVASTFYHKMAMPWICLLAVLAPAPFCVRFSRNIPIFFIYAFSIFGFVAFFLILDAATVLGKRQVLEPAWAIWPPFGLIYGTVMWRFSKL